MFNKFEKSLERGRVGENIIAKWFIRKGYSVLPVYEKEKEEGEFRGPTLFQNDRTLIAPDMLVFNMSGKAFWIEAKHKSAFAWFRNSQCWTTGIDRRHYLDYLKVQDSTPYPVWLVFLQRDGSAKDTPTNLRCPSGLFGRPLEFLRNTVHCEYTGHAASGKYTDMVYWSSDSLLRIASIEELLA